ncbi:FtsK/SpoIIIE domain-containing protein, partial [Cellulomonas sp. ICMP 17802]|uniref:FtsK/SpoIIIE domain-containing protein n=1 Tax=Cellulomonas sp. ICMP 17802 TaxID=3239199 RepID=UPI00351AC1E4
PLGVGPGGGTTTVDLVRDGPHLLVAGTTGAGKSELLTTLVLALALTHPPDRLAVLLVDFKGGTGLGPVAVLPHVLEHVTDLDAAHARRVLAALRAELRRREGILVAAGARDLRDLDPAAAGTPPRLLVVVDELRALTEDVPDASAALARIAAQGRALGVHLVLATQRPAGAVGADLRANLALRIALRVTDPADSTDVLDAPDAARINPATPGRAWLRRGSRPLEPVQVARAVATSARPVVRPARAWPDGATWSPTRVEPRERADAVEEWVRAAVRAAALRPPGARPPWLPGLPREVRVDDVPAGTGLPLAVADLPDQLRRGAVRWDPAGGHLLVLGGPRSGRTTTLLTVGTGALARGWHVHAVGLPGGAVDRLRGADAHGGLGSVLDTDDARASARLLELLAAGPTPAVLLVDRLDLLLESLGRLARGAGAERLTALWRGATGRTAVAAGSDAGAGTLHHAAGFAHRLVLPLADPALDVLAGVPAALAGGRSSPGRAVHLHASGAVLCQVALPGELGDPEREPASAPPVRVRPLPDRADLPGDSRARTDPLAVPLGRGGDDAGILWVDLAHGLLVAGPPGSGRSTALEVVAVALVRAGCAPLRLVDPAAGAPGLPGVRDVTVDDLDAACRRATGPPVLLVDDLDDLERSHPSLGGLLGSVPTGSVVAAVTSASAAQAFRGAVPVLLRRRRTLVLDVHDPASAELVGPRAAWSEDPRRRPPGRGVLLQGRDAAVVQVYSTGA